MALGVEGLRRAGVLGLNRRNADYVSLLNPRRLYPLVDDKLRTKELAIQAGIAVPELYGVIGLQHEIRDLPRIIEGREQFVLKPAHGSGGNGVLVITGRRGDRFRRASGWLVDLEDLGHHVSNALSGLYSLGGQPDRVMVEYCVQTDPVLDRICFQGVPDIRVIVAWGYPVMSMVRLPTRQSDGKANLHQGAVGCGVELATGRTLSGVLGNLPVDDHPDTGHRLSGLQLPEWVKILELAARCFELTGLGYLGVDLVIDRDQGPLILELNARPGLNIQIANRAGLLRRLRQVEAMAGEEASCSDRIERVQRSF
jgi:alpha-L-glutamate ligase-like protein